MQTQSGQATAEGMPNVHNASKSRAERAVDTGYLVSALINVCTAAAYFADENEGYPVARHTLPSLAKVLEYVDTLVGEMHTVIEIGVRTGAAA